MRISDKHRAVINDMEKDGYVWLSHMPVTAQMRFRSRVKKGFKGYLVIENLTFLTKRVAEAMVVGTVANGGKRLPLGQQVRWLEDRLVELEAEIYRLRGVGPKQKKFKYAVEGVEEGQDNER